MSLLIVNADDFGLTDGVSRGVLRAHTDGIVTSTSLLVVGEAFERTAHWLESAPELGLGVHLAAVGGDRPLLSTKEVPTLVDPTGRLWHSWRSFVPRALLGRIDPAELRRELAAQIEHAIGKRLTITHLDSHQHVHSLPLVAEIVIDLARAYRIPAIRVPRSSGRRLAGYGVRLLAARLERDLAFAGLRFTREFYGFDEAGNLGQPVLDDVLRRVQSSGNSTIELCCHPGEQVDPSRSDFSWGYRWGDELAALTRKGLRSRLESCGVELGSYRALVASGAAAAAPTEGR